MNAQKSLAVNYLRKYFQRIECDWMTSRSTVMLVGSDLGYAGNVSEVRTEGSRPTFYFNFTTMAPPEKKVMVHKKSVKRGSWALHGIEG